MSSMGGQAFQEMKRKQPVERSRRINRYVSCVTTALTNSLSESPHARGRLPASWEIVVFRDASANAFALPGGKMGVHTGLLKVAKTPDQLAAVMGHEIGHVLARHGNERVSQSLIVQLGMKTAEVSLKNKESRGAILAAFGIGSTLGTLKFSRRHESESDEIGQDLMARAGFDPRESIELWKNMARASKGSPPEFLSTHPSHSSRVQQLQSQLRQTLPLYEQAKQAGRNPNCKL